LLDAPLARATDRGTIAHGARWSISGIASTAWTIPFVAGPPARLRGAPVGHQAGVAHALQLGAHAVGVQSQPLGQLDGGGGAAELPQEREQPSTRRLGERVVVPVGLGEVNTSQFSHLAVRNRRCMVGCRRLSGEAAVR
jgi:hypothetical protein